MHTRCDLCQHLTLIPVMRNPNELPELNLFRTCIHFTLGTTGVCSGVHMHTERYKVIIPWKNEKDEKELFLCCIKKRYGKNLDGKKH